MNTSLSLTKLTWIRTTRSNRCPVCHTYGYCEISNDSSHAHCMRVPSGIEMRYRQGGWLHILQVSVPATAADLRSKLISIPAPAQKGEPLLPAQVDKINRRLLELCPISAQHKKYLVSAGIDPTGIGTLVKKEASRIAKLLVQEVGETIIKKHPAVVERATKDGRKWWTLAIDEDGLLFPAINIDNLILGIQIRKEEPKGKDDRYRWLGHDGLAGTPLTVFKARGENKYLVILTEGYKKAALGAQAWQCHAISLAGVEAYKQAELLATIKQLGVNTVALAFDQDKRQNKKVERAEQKLLSLIKAAFPHIQTYYLNWPEDQGKGLDDAIQAGAAFSWDVASSAEIAENQTRFVNNLPGELVAWNFTNNKKVHTLAEARSIHRDFFIELLSKTPDFSQTVITSPTGSGKSTAADNALADLVLTGKLKGRWGLLAPNKANIAERIRPGTALGEAVRRGLVVIQQGRELIDLTNPKQVRSPFDCANSQAQEAGAKRQIAARVICKDCPFGSQTNWEKSGGKGDRPFKCEEEGYLHSRKRSEKAQVVIATKEAYLNGSEQLDDFDGEIVDEGLLSYLIEVIRVDSNVLAGWREKIALKAIDAPNFEKLIQVIETAFDNLAADPDNRKIAKLSYVEPIDAPGPLVYAAELKGYNYAEILEDCRCYRHTDKDGTHDFESPYKHNAKTVLPFRAARELIERLTDQTNPARFERNLDGSYSLVLTQVRGQLVDIHRSKTLVVLDATLQPELKKFLLPELTELHISVPQNVHITQTVNALYTKRDLNNDKTRQTVEKAIDAFVAPDQKHLTILPLRFEEAINLPQNTDKGHWGKDERATNQYTDYDSLALVGHHLRPILQIRAEVIACRSYARMETPAPATDQQRFKLYNIMLPDGSTAGRWMKCDPDLDVQAAIEHDYQANIIQAIGRLRPALRSAGAAPARVLLLCNEPVGDLAIQQLATATELITTPPKNQIFICNNYMKTDEKGDLVPSYTDVQEGCDPWDFDLEQDETPESQLYDPWNCPDHLLAFDKTVLRL